MKPRTRILLVSLMVTAWVIPMFRAASFWISSWRTYQAEQTLNAWNDFDYAESLVALYLISMCAPVALLFLRRLSASIGFVTVVLFSLIAIDLIRIHPEEVIVLIPSMNPVRPI